MVYIKAQTADCKSSYASLEVIVCGAEKIGSFVPTTQATEFLTQLNEADTTIAYSDYSSWFYVTGQDHVDCKEIISFKIYSGKSCDQTPDSSIYSFDDSMVGNDIVLKSSSSLKKEHFCLKATTKGKKSKF